MSEIWLSLRVAGLAASVSLALGLWVAWLLTHREFSRKRIVEAAIALPLALPPAILCSYFLFRSPSRRRVGAIVVVYAFPVGASGRRCVPGVNRDYEKAALSLGASSWRVFSRISLPLSYKPILAATAIAFVRIAAEFAVVLVIAEI